MGQTIVASMKSFMAELMRRNVLRAGLVYLALSWVVLQLTVTIGGRTGAPPELAQAVAAMLALGFIAALVLTWLYEITPQGFTRTKDVSEEQTITHTTARRLDHIILAVLALVAVVALVERLVISKLITRAPIVATPAPVEAPQPPPVVVQSLAVLPFAVTAAARPPPPPRPRPICKPWPTDSRARCATALRGFPVSRSRAAAPRFISRASPTRPRPWRRLCTSITCSRAI